MMTKRKTKFIHEGKYVVEVDVELIVDETEWSPYLSLEEACKLDKIKGALREGNLKAAAELANVYELHPIVM
ncbi:MAG: hypothetical protein D6723_01390 [Acidobacteria bacterium]|nr:MAG: hypothetical protein D6723_01390 [Acidobacteriota bacterium]